jgi:gluconolactonase
MGQLVAIESRPSSNPVGEEAYMKRLALIFTIATVLSFGISPVSAQEVDAESRAKIDMPVEFARVGSFTEGPVFDKLGNLYVSHGTLISKIAPDGTVSVWAETGSPSGHKVLSDGTHLVCDTTVLHLAADGRVLGTAAETCGPYPTRATNDLTIDPKGGFYFTDPGVISEGALERPIGRVGYAGPGGKTNLVAEELLFPNGIVLSQDGHSLIVGEFGKNRILRYPILEPGQVGEMEVLAELPSDGIDKFMGPDGMAFATDGNLYVAHFGTGKVRVIGPDGQLLKSLPGGSQNVSNLTFGGALMQHLYMTGSGPTFEPGVIHRLSLEGASGSKIPANKSD